jgi:hypothetical protein
MIQDGTLVIDNADIVIIAKDLEAGMTVRFWVTCGF